MSRRAASGLFVLVLLAWPCVGAWSQDVVGELLGGKLINPKVGQWIWYNLTDAEGKPRYVVRQAVVGEEKVGKKQGHWVEFEVVPEVGYKTIYKVLLTGPASDARNIHRIIGKQGPDPASEVPIDRENLKEKDAPRPKQESLGMEAVTTGEGPMQAEHIRVTAEGRTIDMWIDERLEPSGIVRMRTPDGEMILRSHGVGGEFAASALDRAPGRSEVRVETSVKDGGTEAGKESGKERQEPVKDEGSRPQESPPGEKGN